MTTGTLCRVAVYIREHIAVVNTRG